MLADQVPDPTNATNNTFKEFLPHLIPVLLKNMAYSENEDVDEGDDETVPDKPDDIRPRNYQGKGEGGGDDDDDDEDGEHTADAPLDLSLP